MVGDSFANAYTFQIPGFNLGMDRIAFGYPAGTHIAENEWQPIEPSSVQPAGERLNNGLA